MNIVIFSPGFPPWAIGGEEYYSYYQAKEMAHMGHYVTVITNGSGTACHASSCLDSVTVNPVAPTVLNNSAIRYALIATKFLLSFLRLKTRPDVIHGHDPYGEGLAAVLAGKIFAVPVVITWHGAELMENEARFSFIGDLSRLLTLRGACRVVVNSEFFKKLVANFTGDSRLPAKTRVVFPGVDSEEFALRNDIRIFRSGLAQKDNFMILAVCRLERIKGLDLLIRSIPSVLESFPDAKFVVVGSGSERASLEALSKRLNVENNVVFTGSVQRSSLPYYFSACDVFVVPTRGEGFGMAFLEAWSCSKPIIVTPQAPEIAKLVGAYGGGIVVEGSSSQLSEAIVGLLSDKTSRCEMGRIGRHIAESKYSWKATASGNVRVYREIVQARASER